MRVDTFVDIVEGKLLNSPSISAFENIRTDPNNVHRGDLFIAHKPLLVKLAIENGAYGVLVDENTKIIDQEIAWIKVNDLQKAVKRLIGVNFIHKNNTFVLVSAFEYDLLNQIIIDKKDIVFLSGCIKEDTECFFNDKENLLFISSNKDYIGFFRDTKYLKNDEMPPHTIIKSSLFETSLKYKNRLFENIKIPKIFLDDFVQTLEYCKNNKIKYSLSGYKCKYFMPFFVDNNFEVVDYGKSQKIIIIEKKLLYAKDEINFLMNAKWINKIILFPLKHKNLIEDIEKDLPIFYFKDKKELKSILKTKIYCTALVFSKKFNITSLKSNITQHSLFNDFKSDGAT